jgi:DNA-binding GntR family transcriptional regulator
VVLLLPAGNQQVQGVVTVEHGQGTLNRFINQTLRVLQDVMHMLMETTLRLPGRFEIARSQHEAILAASADEDGDRTAELTLEHISGARCPEERVASEVRG